MKGWKPVSFDKNVDSADLIGIEEIVLTEENGVFKLPSADTVGKVSGKRKKKKQKTKIENKKIKQVKKCIKNNITPKFKNLNSDQLSKLKSWTSFGLHEEILLALYEKKFFEPTEIQSRCLGPAICGRLDILGAAETGSGKTLAFGIPIVNGILNLRYENKSVSEDSDDSDDSTNSQDSDDETKESNQNAIGCVKSKKIKTIKEKNKLYALILTPTRELAVQIKDHLLDICKYTGINVALVVGGLAHEKQERILKKRPEIVVATPGRLWELINSRNIHLQDIKNIRFLAIDETDRMLEKGHFAELNELLERINLNENRKKRRQNFVFSATLTMVHDPPVYLKGKKRKRITPGQKLQDLISHIGITNPKIIDITSSRVTAENLMEFKIFCSFEEKDYYLYQFLQKHRGRAIVFCNSIGCVKRLANLLTIVNLRPLPIHANMEQKQRLKNLEKFRINEDSLLLATDVAARGLDIPNVDHVIHYQVPKTAEIYVHRSGRTARINATGNALLLVEPAEFKTYTKLLQTLGRDKQIEDFNIELDTFSHAKKIIHLARDIDQLSLSLRRENSKSSWYEKAIKDLDIIVDDDELPKRRSSEADARIRKDLKLKKKELNALLQNPSFPKHFSAKYPDINIKYNDPLCLVRRDKLKIPGAYVLKNVPIVV